MELGYIAYWPESQKYEELDGFYDHAICIADGEGYVIEKEWLDEQLKDKEDKEDELSQESSEIYKGFWDI